MRLKTLSTESEIDELAIDNRKEDIEPLSIQKPAFINKGGGGGIVYLYNFILTCFSFHCT